TSGCASNQVSPPEDPRNAPTPSTWPCTMCPPSGSPARSAGSTFTSSPAARPPSVERSSVSATTSKESVPSSRSATVRHTPALPNDSREHGNRLRLAEVPLEQDVLADRSSAHPRKPERLGQVADEARTVTGDDGRDEQHQLVHEARCEERGRKRRPALQQQRLHALGSKRMQLVLERAAAQLVRRLAVAECEPARLSRRADV